VKVSIKSFDVDMEIKTKGIELEVRDPSGIKHLGDLVLTKTEIIWCAGRQRRGNGKALSWEKFIDLVKDL
jgi:hypothetical protein